MRCTSDPVPDKGHTQAVGRNHRKGVIGRASADVDLSAVQPDPIHLSRRRANGSERDHRADSCGRHDGRGDKHHHAPHAWPYSSTGAQARDGENRCQLLNKVRADSL
jgi:hypothetical protein